jgi:pre-mRNA-splicing factor SPF27
MYVLNLFLFLPLHAPLKKKLTKTNPDIDTPPSEEALAAARALIEAETATSSPKPPTEAKQEPSFSPAIQTEQQRIASHAPLDTFDKRRYEAQEAPAPGEDSSPEALRQPLERAYVSSSYLASRNQNLALLDRAGKNAWLLSNYHVEAELRAIEAELAATKREIDLVNAARATRQNDVKAEIQGLEETWRKGVGRVLETEIAVEELRSKIRQELKAKSVAQEQ